MKRKNDTHSASDRYYFSPNDGKKFRSMAEVNRYLNDDGLDMAKKTATTSTTTTTSKTKNLTTSSSSNNNNTKKKKPQKYPVGTTLSKMFHDKDIGQKRAYSGEIVKYDAIRGLYWVKYEDGDEEELSEKKLSAIINVKTDDDDDDEGGGNEPKHYPHGTAVSKMFHDEDLGQDRAYSGKVMEYDSIRQLYLIRYEDGDEEELNEEELSMIVVAGGGGAVDTEQNNGSGKQERHIKRKSESSPSEVKKTSAKKKPRTSDEIQSSNEKNNALEMLMSKTPRRSAKKKVVYTEESDLDEEDESMDEALPKKGAKKKSGVGTKNNKAGIKDKKKRIELDSDSDEFEPGREAEEEDESLAADSESEMEIDSEAEYQEAPKQRNRKKSPSTKKLASAKGSAKKNGDTKSAPKKGEKPAPDSIEALCAAKAKDIKLLNNPQQFPEDGPYVEPVGIDATDGIVEGIIGGMVQKVGKLLLKTIERNDADRELGELSFPIKLNTACSGTDAPSIALGLVKESLDRFCSSEQISDGGEKASSTESSGNHEKGHGFDYEHNMSCEIEPFKQAYIGRNFPGVLLFPDITKLTEKETVVDVYGRAQKIPKGERGTSSFYCCYPLSYFLCSTVYLVY